ncbi:MAG: retroviral-like aspartic protease [Nitrospirae bacterium]|nr:retroviral-like aspartic protease [Nitrospirota bacterium]
MSVIQKSITLEGSKRRRREEALFNSGATYSCIREDVARSLDLLIPLPRPLRFGTAENGHTVKATHAVRLDFRIGRYRFSDEFMVIPSLSEPVLIGAATLQKWRFKLDFENDEVIIDPRVTKLRLL